MTKHSVLTFDEANHEYRLMPWGEIPPSVTEIINSVFPFEGKGLVAERAADFGVAAHKAIELDIKSLLDLSTMDTALQPYLNQFWNWFYDNRLLKTQCQTEVRLYSKKYKFCGSIDIVEKEIFDIKTGEPHPKHRLQIAAYRHLWNINYPKDKKTTGRIIYLDGSDKLPLVVTEKPPDFGVFLALKEIYNFRKGENICEAKAEIKSLEKQLDEERNKE